MCIRDSAKAVTDHYAIGEASNYNISSAGVDLTNLVIDKIEVTTGNDKDLAGAVRAVSYTHLDVYKRQLPD